MTIKNTFRKIRTWFLGVLASLGAVLGIYHATAQTSPTQDVLTWAMPTLYSDGSALAASDIAKTTIVWGSKPGGPYTDGTQDVAAPATTVAISRTANYGTRCYKASVTTTPAAGGVQSLWSNEACKTVQAPPAAPTGLTVQ